MFRQISHLDHFLYILRLV